MSAMVIVFILPLSLIFCGMYLFRKTFDVSIPLIGVFAASLIGYGAIVITMPLFQNIVLTVIFVFILMTIVLWKWPESDENLIVCVVTALIGMVSLVLYPFIVMTAAGWVSAMNMAK